MKKIALSLVTLIAVGAAVAGATRAYFSDTETSTGNTFAAGTLDLTVDGNNGVNVVKFSIPNMRPGNQPKGTYTLNNIGTIGGYLNINSIVATNTENGCIEPEVESGDLTCDPGSTVGELGDVLNGRLFTDLDCNGWIGTGDVTFFNGKVSTMPSTFTLNKSIPAGQNACVTAIFDWWDTVDDNKAMTDGLELDMSFSLTQNAL